jgi:phosphoribosylformylglycinamidine synthase subunit PurS
MLGSYTGPHIWHRRQFPMKTRIFVTLKNGVLDPQGKAIHHALEGLGFDGVSDVRAGRLIEIEHDASVSTAQLEDMSRKLLANMVIENFEIEAK